jgi:hypothetical protein
MVNANVFYKKSGRLAILEQDLCMVFMQLYF